MSGLAGMTLASLAAAGVALAAIPPVAHAYPTKPVRIITAGAGTFHDIVTRHLGQRLGERWGQPVVVENQPAAALTIGTGIAARATPDGYTLLMSDRSALAVAPHLYKKIPYDPVGDFAPITLVALAPTLFVVHPSVPAGNLRELIEYAKRQPGGINLASAGPGTNPHVMTELLKQATGIPVTVVHYKGGGASVLAILGGEMKAGFNAVPTALPHIATGRLKALAVTGKQRFAGTPDVPTASESGIAGLEVEFWVGMLAPARTPARLVESLNTEIVALLRTQEMQATLRGQGAEPAPGKPSEFAAFIAAEAVKMKKLIEQTGMRAE